MCFGAQVLLTAKSLSVGDVLCSEPPLTWQPVPAMPFAEYARCTDAACKNKGFSCRLRRASLCARCGATQALLRCAVCQQVMGAMWKTKRLVVLTEPGAQVNLSVPMQVSYCARCRSTSSSPCAMCADTRSPTRAQKCQNLFGATETRLWTLDVSSCDMWLRPGAVHHARACRMRGGT